MLLILAFIPACSSGRNSRENGPEPVYERAELKKIIPANLPTVVASTQFKLETDLSADLAVDGSDTGSSLEPERDLAMAVLSRLETYFRTLYTLGFGLSSDKISRKFSYYKHKNRATVASRENFETHRPHPVALIHVVLFTSEKDYRAYVEKAHLQEYYRDAALDKSGRFIVTYLHGSEEETFDALFRLICHSFIIQQLSLDFPSWLEFGLTTYLTKIDMRRGIYPITGKDLPRLRKARNILKKKKTFSLIELLTERGPKAKYNEEKRLLAYGFVYWMCREDSREKVLFKYVHSLRDNELKYKALAAWKSKPEDERKKIKRPDPEPESRIQNRFFKRLNDLESMEKYWKRWILEEKYER